MNGPAPEHVVLLSEDGHAVGTAPKSTVHHASTPLHLAFSCYVFDADGRLLLTQRALSKQTWPGAWTNTACGHPASGETAAQAVVRRVRQELGLGLTDLRLVLPRFRYRAQMPNGVVENELCPVFTARADGEPAPDPEEVEDYAWVDWTAFLAAVAAGRRTVSPWCVDQLRALTPLGPDPADWVAQEASELPQAAR